MVIGGKEVAACSGRTFESIDPTTEEPCGIAPDAGAEDVADAVAAARRAFDDGPWPRMSARQRSEALARLRDAIAESRQELEQISIEECGLNGFGRYANVDGGLGIATWVVENCVRPDFEALPPIVHPDGRVVGSMALREPAGVVAAITPFNVPFAVNIYKAFPALAMGCTVVLKPSPYTPLNALILGRLALEAEIPEGVLNVVAGREAAVGEALVSDPRIDMVSFTGSTAVGKRIYESCAANVTRVLLELGGKSPNLVLEDCDLDVTVPGVLFFPYVMHSGQICFAMTRMIVPEKIHDQFVERLTAAIEELPVGDPRDPSTMIVPLISAQQRERVLAYIASGRQEGARVATGGGRPAHLERGYFVEPTLLTQTSNDMRVNREEIFGPVCTVIRYSGDVDEGVRIANDTTYGLNATVWTRDRSRGLEIGRRLRAGQVGVNGFAAGSWTPMGGYKESGIGREGGVYGLLEYTELKHLHWQ